MFCDDSAIQLPYLRRVSQCYLVQTVVAMYHQRMSAAAALVASDKAASIKDGVAMAAEAIDSGKAKESLESLIALSQKLD